MTRTFEEVFDQYLAALVNSGSGLVVDRTQGSFSYTLARAAASVATLQDARFEELSRSANPATAVGTDLSRLGAAYQIVRGAPEVARGFALAISQSTQTTVPPNTLLVDLETGLQYFVSGTQPVTVPTFAEVQVQIQADQPGGQYNAASGTTLFCPNLPSVRFTVGGSRSSDGLYYGDLTGGQDAESDSSYRARLISSLSGSEPYSVDFLVKKLLQYPSVNRAFVSTNLGGVVEIWVDSVDIVYQESQLEEIKRYIKPFCAPGIIPVVVRATRIPINVELRVTPLGSTTSLDSLKENLLTMLTQYFDSLSVGETFNTQVFLKLIRPLVRSAQLISPKSDVPAYVGQVLTLGSAAVTYSLTP